MFEDVGHRQLMLHTWPNHAQLRKLLFLCVLRMFSFEKFLGLQIFRWRYLKYLNSLNEMHLELYSAHDSESFIYVIQTIWANWNWICFVSTNLNVERYHPSFYVHLLKIIRSPSFLLFLHKICTRFELCKDLGRQNSSFPKTTFPDFGQLEYSHNLDAFPLHLRVFCAFAQIIGSPLHLLSFLPTHLHNLYIWPELTTP